MSIKMNEGRAYAGILMEDGTELAHYGVKGMKWGKHKFGLKSLDPTRRFNMTDTGTGSSSDLIRSRMNSYFTKRDARAKAAAAASAAKREADLKRAAAEEKASKKKKSSGSKAKGGSSKSAAKKEKKEDKNALPDSLVEKLKNPNATLTTDDIRLRATKGTGKAKELLKKLPKNFTKEDIDDLWDNESDQRGVGYDAYVLEIATYTAEMKYYGRMIDEAEKKFTSSKDTSTKQQLRVYINEIKKKQKQSESDLRTVLRTGHSLV